MSTMITRRNVFALIGAAVTARMLPAIGQSLPLPRCDADYIEGEWAAGRAVVGGTFFVRRGLRMPDHSTLSNCRVTFEKGSGGISFLDGHGYGRITYNVFMAES